MKTLLALITASITTSIAYSAEIIFSDRRDDDSFKRISEHFGGKENSGRYAIARTDPNQRDGYYVALKLDAAERPKETASIRIQYVRPASQDVETQSIPVETISKRRVLVGLTDGIWASSEAIPTAWKIDFLDSQGQTLVSSQSFLWSSQPNEP